MSLLGESAVDITPASRARRFPNGAMCRRDAPRRSWRTSPNQAGQGISELTALLTDIRAGRGTVGKLMTDEQLYVELTGSCRAPAI